MVLTLIRGVKHSRLKEPSNLLKVDSTNPLTTLLHFKHSLGTETPTVVLNSSYIRQFYIYRPQALENVEDNLESQVREFHFQNQICFGDSRPPKENCPGDCFTMAAPQDLEQG